jgi:hypothetical protein
LIGQSVGQLELFSVGPQIQFPQKSQSSEQVNTPSPLEHSLSPQVAGQSWRHVSGFSNIEEQIPSPHWPPQSLGQDAMVSLVPHQPSPQIEQSTEQVRDDSEPVQIPSPQRVQSVEQLSAVSRLVSQIPSPQ